MHGSIFLLLLILNIGVIWGLPSAPYPDWAHSHWIWQSADIETQEGSLDLYYNYTSRNIPVGCVDIDSGWLNGYDDLKVNTKKFPQMKQMIDTLHSDNTKVILWSVSMVDVDSSVYEYARNNSFFIRDGFNEQMNPIKWWHGKGCLLDYFNPDALRWWHSLMDPILDLGIDGWKVDGTDPYILELLTPRIYNGSYISYRDYANAYYGDFFNYTRSRQGGDDRLIMSRPVDSYKSLFLNFSPRYLLYSGWVGDLDGTWGGLIEGVNRMRASSELGYVNFGSDIAGYRDNTKRELSLFIRWFQLGTFNPLMENGGNGQHTPWSYDAPGATDITDLYREFVLIHMSLGPYFLTVGTLAFETKNKSAMTFTSSDEYLLGNDIFVAIMTSNATSRTITFPPAVSGWIDWFSGTRYAGEEVIVYPCALNTYPVFKRAGAILILDADAYARTALSRASFPASSTSSFISSSSSSSPPSSPSSSPLLAAISVPDLGSTHTYTHTQEVREHKGTGLVFSYTYTRHSYTFDDNPPSTSMTINTSPTERRVSIRVSKIARPVRVSVTLGAQAEVDVTEAALTPAETSVDASVQATPNLEAALGWTYSDTHETFEYTLPFASEGASLSLLFSP